MGVIMSSNIKSGIDETLKQLRYVMYACVGLYTSYIIIFTNPALDEFQRVIIFGLVMGGTCFVVFTMLVIKHIEKKKLLL